MSLFWNRREHSNSKLVLKQTGTQKQWACSETEWNTATVSLFWNRREHSNSELVLKQTGTQQQWACSETGGNTATVSLFWNRREHSNSELVLKQTGTQQQWACSHTRLFHCGKWSPHLLHAYRWNLAEVKTTRITPALFVTRSVHARKLPSSLRSSAASFQRFCCRHNYVKSNISFFIFFFPSFFVLISFYVHTVGVGDYCTW